MHGNHDALMKSWQINMQAAPKRPRTIAMYVDELTRMAAWLELHDLPATDPGNLLAVSRDDAEAWVAGMRQDGRADTTVRNRWVAAKAFFRWAEDSERIDTNPMAKVRVTKPTPPPPDVLSLSDVTAMLATCDARNFNDRRDAALIRLMIDTGMRASEITALVVDDVDLGRRTVDVDGKGGKPRVARFTAKTGDVIDRYLVYRAKHRMASRPELWLGLHGPLSRKSLGPIIERRAKAAGIGHVHPHQLRHTWAHHMKTQQASDETMMVLGGWSNTETMRRYGAATAAERALDTYDTIAPFGDV
jgi:site-specific recombinase XerD